MGSRSYCWTINNALELDEHGELDYDGFINRCASLFADPPAGLRYASWQLEEAPETGMWHLQGYSEFDAPKRISAIKRWGGVWERAHLEVRQGTREQARNYTREEETRVDGPWEFGQWIGGQGARSDLSAIGELVDGGASVRDIAGEHPAAFIRYHGGIERLHALRGARNVEVEDISDRLHAWQLQLRTDLEGQPHARKVIWICDVTGGGGKSTFAKWWIRNNQDSAYFTSGRHDRILHGWNGERTVFFDFARAVNQDGDRVPYGVLESIKNGLVYSGMYGLPARGFPVPHVVVFANFMPNEAMLSADRWDIRNI